MSMLPNPINLSCINDGSQLEPKHVPVNKLITLVLCVTDLNIHSCVLLTTMGISHLKIKIIVVFYFSKCSSYN